MPTPRPARPLTPVATLLLVSLLAGCAGAPPAEVTQVPAQPLPAVQPGMPPAPNRALSMDLPPSVHAETFAAAETALLENDWMRADTLLAALEPPLNADDQTYREYLQARVHFLRGNLAATREALAPWPAPQTAPGIAVKVDNLRRYDLHMQGDYLASARLGAAQLESGLSNTEPAALVRSIWSDLAHLSVDRLSTAEDQAAAEQPGSSWHGWLALARIGAGASGTAELAGAVADWRAQFPGHPAAKPLPGGLDPLLNQPVDTGTVALLLPLSGRLAPAARAVLDGYLASYYAARARGVDAASLLVLDSSQYATATAAYNDAVLQGASLVVGPLSKEGVTELGQLKERAVPVLALNRSDQPVDPGRTALVQMSLAPEDDAERLANLAFGQGARRALLVYPGGEWGDKMRAALEQRWQALGGEIVTRMQYASAEAYSDNLLRSLDIDDSEQRARDVRSMLATNIEFTARRRQDIDSVFLLAGSAGEARSLKPLLAFHYAGELPVYAPSSVYNGVPDEGNRDLNGMRLVDLPWLLGASPSLRVAIAAGDTGSDSYTRLNALGADAHLLQTRFGQLQGGPDALLRGNTGLLRMDPRLRILREPQPAVFDGGEIRPL